LGQYAVKLTDKDKQYYIHWSEIVDAPVYVAVSLDDYRAYFRDRFGRDADESSERRGDWKRLEETGLITESYQTPEEAVACNRAGTNERQLTVEGIRRRYLRGRTESGVC